MKYCILLLLLISVWFQAFYAYLVFALFYTAVIGKNIDMYGFPIAPKLCSLYSQ